MTVMGLIHAFAHGCLWRARHPHGVSSPVCVCVRAWAHVEMSPPHPPCPVPMAARTGNRVAITPPAPPAPPPAPTPTCASPTAPASCRPHAGTSHRGPVPWSRSAASSAWTWGRCVPSASSSGESLSGALPGRWLVVPLCRRAGLRVQGHCRLSQMFAP